MATNPTLLTMPLAQNGQKNVIPETQATAGDGLFSQSTGFPAETSLPLGAGGVAPSREDFNGLANLLGGVAFMAQKGWQFQFDAGQEYFAGCIVRDTTDGKLYECLNDVAAGGSVPSADTVNWKKYNIDTSTFADTDLSNLTATGEARFAHVVIDSYYDSTTGDWWRQYADGWVEQGGIVTVNNTSGTITILKPTTTNKCNVQLQVYASDTRPYPCQVTTLTTTTISWFSNSTTNSIIWYVCGMGASA